MYVRACEIDGVAVSERDAERVFDLRRREAELRGEQSGLQADVRARDDFRHDAQGNVGALAHRAGDARHLLKLEQ